MKFKKTYFMGTLIQDLRLAVRMLIKNPGFSAVVVLTLGLGIGINTANFSIIDAVLLRPLPYPEPGRLVVVQKDWKPFWAPNGEIDDSFDTKEVLAWQEFNGAFSQQTAYQIKSFIRLRGVDLGFRPDRILSLRVDLSKTKYPHARSQAAYFEQVLQGLRELPGVEALGADASLPLGGYNVVMLQSGFQSMSLAVRTRADPLKLAGAVRSHILRIDKDQPIHSLATLEQRLADDLSPQRVNMQLSSALGVLALSLVAVGIYGVLAFSVAQRTHEIGVRMALGAQAGDVVWLVVRQGLSLTLAGVGAGLLAAFWLTRFLSSLLYGVTALDPSTFAAASVLLLLIALAARSIPARRAAQVDPMVALTDE
jgi:hypothetical protein